MIRQFELVERVKSYDPNADEDLLNRAYVFSMKAHGSQERASGDPYFLHPLEVANILTRLKLDTASIVTRCCTTRSRIPSATLEQIERNFGKEIAKLVDGVTKLSRLELQSDQSKQAENFRKLVLAMSEDIRVLLVKLADRLHNMQTLEHIKSPEKRKRIAHETLEIYAPLAERIGMHQLKDELEDLAFAELNPEARESIVQRLNFLRETGRRRRRPHHGRTEEGAGKRRPEGHGVRPRETALLDLAEDAAQEHRLRAARRHHGVPRRRRRYRRLLPGAGRPPWPLSHGARAVQGLHLSTPKPNGYRSIHTGVIGPEKQRIEMQIRTQEMHEIAELGVAAHWSYKQGADRQSKDASIAGCANCWTSSNTHPDPRNSSSTPSSRCTRTRCSASRPRAI